MKQPQFPIDNVFKSRKLIKNFFADGGSRKLECHVTITSRQKWGFGVRDLTWRTQCQTRKLQSVGVRDLKNACCLSSLITYIVDLKREKYLDCKRFAWKLIVFVKSKMAVKMVDIPHNSYITW